MLIKYLFASCCFIFSPLYSDEIDVTQPLRIESLLPLKNRMYSLAIEPAIPENFAALSSRGADESKTFSLVGELKNDDLYWGPEKVLLAFFTDRRSLSEPIFSLGLCPEMMQPQYGHLDKTRLIAECNEFNRSDQGKLSLHFGDWGHYPYCIMQGTCENHKIDTAFIGLNHESGAVFRVFLFQPKNTSPEIEIKARNLWKTFFEQTKMLPEPLLYKAHGQELHTGFTLLKILDRTVKVTAERRKSDRCIRLTVEPDSPQTEFKLEATSTIFKGKEWRLGDPLLKLKGAYILDKGWVHLSMMTSIFLNEVDEFTPVSLFKCSLLRDIPLDPLTASLGTCLR